jgi:F0F1-type ATP synthase membrane subunit c/vacuolar-type H+-ATPase subunit K
MIPFTTVTSNHRHFAMALVVFIGVTVIGFSRHGLGYLKLFVPAGVPMALLPLLAVIEVLSYLIRPVSLSVRVVREHDGRPHHAEGVRRLVVMLGVLGGWAPLAFVVALTGLEFGIAVLQALRLHHPDLHLSERCGPHASLSATRYPKRRTSTTGPEAAAKLIGAGLATIALAGVGVGIGNIFGSFVSGALRNPAAAPKVFGNVLLGFALTEAIALFALLIALLLLFVF